MAKPSWFTACIFTLFDLQGRCGLASSVFNVGSGWIPGTESHPLKFLRLPSLLGLGLAGGWDLPLASSLWRCPRTERISPAVQRHLWALHTHTNTPVEKKSACFCLYLCTHILSHAGIGTHTYIQVIIHRWYQCSIGYFLSKIMRIHFKQWSHHHIITRAVVESDLSNFTCSWLITASCCYFPQWLMISFASFSTPEKKAKTPK